MGRWAFQPNNMPYIDIIIGTANAYTDSVWHIYNYNIIALCFL